MIESIRYYLNEIWINWFIVPRDNILRIFRFLPVLWRDWDFEPNGLYNIIRIKIEGLRKCKAICLHLDREKDCAEMDRAIDLCKKLHKDEYDYKAFIEFEKKHGLNIENANRRLTQNQKDEFWVDMNKSTAEQKRDKRELFDILNHLNNWWS